MMDWDVRNKKEKKSLGFVGVLGKCRLHSIYCHGILTGNKGGSRRCHHIQPDMSLFAKLE